MLVGLAAFLSASLPMKPIRVILLEVHTFLLFCPFVLLAQPSQLEGFAWGKPFRISEGYPKVFTTGKGAGDLF